MSPSTVGLSPRDAIDVVLREPHWEPYAEYTRQQRPRIEHLLELSLTLLGTGEERRVLDCGPFLPTAALRRVFPTATVDSLGSAVEFVAPREGERHVEFDLNHLYDRERWPDIRDYDLISFAEILEHLCTAPQAVFNALAGWLVPGGHLVVQTPNALDLPARVRTLLGRTPTGAIGTLPDAGVNLGHFREYTAGEVVRLGEVAGLETTSVEIHEYFARDGTIARAWSAVAARLPPTLRPGMTVVFRRPR